MKVKQSDYKAAINGGIITLIIWVLIIIRFTSLNISIDLGTWVCIAAVRFIVSVWIYDMAEHIKKPPFKYAILGFFFTTIVLIVIGAMGLKSNQLNNEPMAKSNK